MRKEFVDDNRVKVNNDGNFVNDLSGRRGIYQAGIKASFSIISQYIHTNNKVIYSTRHKHFVLCVGTALRCKGGGGNSNEEYQQEYSPLYHNVDERDEKLKAEITLP